MNINQVQYFISVAENKSFSAAAFDCYISQSSISKQIKALEEEFNVLFFERKHSRIELTPAGKVFYKFAKKSIVDYNEMQILLEEYQDALQSTIAIGTIPILSSYGITNIIAAFSNHYNNANICFDVSENSQSTILKELLLGIINLAIVRIINPEEMNDFEYKPFCTDTLVVACHKDHPLTKVKEPLTLELLSKHDLYLMDVHSNLNVIPMNAFKKQNITPTLRGTTTRHKILLEILNNKRVFSILPERLVDETLFPDIVTLPLEKPITSDIAILKVKGRRLNKVTKEFWDFWTGENIRNIINI